MSEVELQFSRSEMVSFNFCLNFASIHLLLNRMGGGMNKGGMGGGMG